MKLSALGELGLIRLLGRGAPRDSRVRVGIGDDTAVVVESPPGHDLLLTCDLLAEGVHFRREWYADSPELLGHKALAVNVSDIAGMGGEPRYCLVTLGVPRDLCADFIRRVYDGLYALAGDCGVSVVGGDTVRFDGGMLLDVFLVGEVGAGRALLRSGARVGDLIVVTGEFGLARAGLEVLERGVAGGCGPSPCPSRASAVRRLLAPSLRLAESRALAGTGRLHALSDTSDGLAAQVALICEASEVGAVVDAAAVPLDPAVDQVARPAGASALGWALYGGEDYELIGAIDPRDLESVRAAMPEGTRPLTVVGRFTAAPEILLRTPDGHTVPLGKAEYQHFDA